MRALIIVGLLLPVVGGCSATIGAKPNPPLTCSYSDSHCAPGSV